MTPPVPTAPAAAERHLLLAFDGHELPGWVADRVRAGTAPGVTLYRFHNVSSPAQVRGLTAELQVARPAGAPPLLVAADQEGGQLLALGPGSTPFAGNLALGAAGDPDLTERVAEAIGREARACGVGVVYAPVCDVLCRPENPALGIRSFGSDPGAAGRHAAAFVRGLQRARVAATAKHFPGNGDVAADTHHGPGVLEAGRALLDARELVPFRAALDAGVRLVMSGHHAVPALTGRADLPATLAGPVLTGLLREELGFAGVAITDALNMRALAQGAGQVAAALAALRAGADLLLCGPDRAAIERLAGGLREARGRGLGDPAALRRSAARVDALRRDLDGTPGVEGLDVVGCPAHRALAAELARRALTLVRDDAALLPLREDARVLAVEPRPRDRTPADTTSTLEPTLGGALRRHHPRVEAVAVSDPPAGGEVAAVVERARASDTVVLGTAAAHLVAEQVALARAVLATGTPTVTVALRTPWDLDVYPGAPTHLCLYGQHAPSTEALAAALVGAAPIGGRLPVALACAPRGHGLQRAALDGR